MPYVDQFDHLQPIGGDRNTHTIVVFTDGLVVSPEGHQFLAPSVGAGQLDRKGTALGPLPGSRLIIEVQD